MVAATGDDEDNLVISLLAKQEFAVPRVVARVNHPKNEWLFNENWGVDVSVSTPHLLTALVEEAVSRRVAGAPARSSSGATPVSSRSRWPRTRPAVDQAIEELGMPRDATVVAVIRERHVVVPRGDTGLEAGDEVLVLVTPDSEDDVRGILTGEE